MKLYYLILLLSLSARADEFLYPVASCTKDGQELVYLLYQKSIKHVELWVWEPATLLVNKALLSSYTPAALRMLPDNSGFSFIDNGRIKIKSFAKRSPKSLDLYEPIYEIGVVEWIDAHHCYFSAKENEQSSIYQANVRGELKKIAELDSADCLYPQKVEDKLFYIARSQDAQGAQSYKIMATSYPLVTFDESNDFNNTENFDLRVQQFLNEQDHQTRTSEHSPQEIIIDFSATLNNQALAFLRMETPALGYVIAHPNSIDKQDKVIPLNYYEIRCNNGTWERKALFSFEIPLDVLMPERSSRLYESMLPLLPRHIGDRIYYVDCSQSRENLNLNIYSYDLIDEKSKKVSQAYKLGQSFFAPIQTFTGIFYGGSIELDSEAPPCMKINDGCMCFELPKI